MHKTNKNYGNHASVKRGVAIAISSLILIACTRQSPDENRHPLFIKAMNEKAKGNFARAEKNLKDYLVLNPKSAAACLELAYLYHDKLDDPLKAVFYYRTYAELQPLSTDKEEIDAFIRASEQKLLKRLLAQNDVDPSFHDQSEVGYIASTKKKPHIPANDKGNTDTENPLSGQKQNRDNDLSHRKAGGYLLQSNAQQKVVYYTVEPGDTLSRIAAKFYGNPARYELILNANKDVLKSENSPLMVGTKLKIPPLKTAE